MVSKLLIFGSYSFVLCFKRDWGCNWFWAIISSILEESSFLDDSTDRFSTINTFGFSAIKI